ncbi:MAG: DUF3299 domain-containing protein [Gammaproteobacteria bacterium]|nr:DUF3299 domain-containing protein [Gammaproteobacteria bacterium]
MVNKFIVVILLFFSSISFSKEVSDDYLSQLVDSWNLLAPPEIYDFMPEKLDYKTMNDPEFQKKIENAGNQINNLIDGKIIEIAGFMVPLKTKGSSVSQFLLVPEAGQCIHVPPPPLNQTLLVEMPQNPTNIRDIYIPIIVTGKVSVGSQSFDIADSGYSLTDVTVENLTFKYKDDL